MKLCFNLWIFAIVEFNHYLVNGMAVSIEDSIYVQPQQIHLSVAGKL